MINPSPADEIAEMVAAENGLPRATEAEALASLREFAVGPISAVFTWSEAETVLNLVETLTKSGIVEVAIRNPSVADYMQHWEGRAEKAEAALTAANTRMSSLQAQAAASVEAEREAKQKLFLLSVEHDNLKDVVFDLESRFEETVAPFVFGNPALEEILWGHLPDDATATVTVQKINLDRARTQLEAIRARSGEAR